LLFIKEKSQKMKKKSYIPPEVKLIPARFKIDEHIQRITHLHIIKMGDEILKKMEEANKVLIEKSVEKAICEEKARGKKEGERLINDLKKKHQEKIKRIRKEVEDTNDLQKKDAETLKQNFDFDLIEMRKLCDIPLDED